MAALSKYYIPGGKSSGIILLFLIFVVTYFHLSTPPDVTIVHIIHYYALYLLVIFAAMKFGFLGGLFSSLLITLLYAPNIYLNLFNLRHYHIRGVVEVLMMYTLGIFAGTYSQRLYLKNCKLQDAYDKLKRYAEEKIHMEQEIARSEKLRVMGQLSAGIAHEIKNPLASLKTASKLLKDGKNKPEILDILMSEIDRLNSFVSRFLQYASFGKIENKKIEVTRLYGELLELLKLLCNPYNDISVIYHNHIDENIFIEGDINNLKQAFLNIFSNSLEELKNIEGHKEITFEVKKEDDVVVFTIKDSGRGFSEEMKERIFEPFFTTKDTGTGLGLTITNKIISEHNGIIEIENCDGACFIIKFKRLKI